MNDNILEILEGVSQYLNDNYGPDESHPKGVIIYPYVDKVVFTCWDCGAIVYINGGIYFISEDDGYWWVNKSTFQINGSNTREVFGYLDKGICIAYAPYIADALIRILRNQMEIKKHFGLIKDDSYYGDCHYDESIIEELEEIE
jgi:hypothetical protein